MPSIRSRLAVFVAGFISIQPFAFAESGADVCLKLLGRAFYGDPELEVHTRSRLSEDLILIESLHTMRDPKSKARIISEVIGTEKIPDESKNATPTASQIVSATLNKFSSSIEPALNFVMANYQNRRTHWPQKFIDHLKDYAKKYLLQSVYITVSGSADSIKGPDDQLLGVLRLINEKNGVLPVEEYLDVSFRSEGKTKVEPGNFAIRSDLNLSTFNEGLVQLLAAMVRRYDKIDDLVFYTYADRQSRAIYKKIGFIPVPENEMHMGRDVKFQRLAEPADGVLISVDEIEWLPMKATFAQLYSIIGNLPTRRSSTVITPEEILRLENRYELLRRPDLVLDTNVDIPTRAYWTNSHSLQVHGRDPAKKRIARVALMTTYVNIFFKDELYAVLYAYDDHDQEVDRVVFGLQANEMKDILHIPFNGGVVKVNSRNGLRHVRSVRLERGREVWDVGF